MGIDLTLEDLMGTSDSMDMVRKREALCEQRDRVVLEKLNNFTVRDVMEAIYGESYTRMMFGENGGKISMRDVKVKGKVDKDGQLRLEVDSDAVTKSLQEVHGLDKNELDTLMKSKVMKNMLSEALREQEKTVTQEADEFFERTSTIDVR